MCTVYIVRDHEGTIRHVTFVADQARGYARSLRDNSHNSATVGALAAGNELSERQDARYYPEDDEGEGR